MDLAVNTNKRTIEQTDMEQTGERIDDPIVIDDDNNGGGLHEPVLIPIPMVTAMTMVLRRMMIAMTLTTTQPLWRPMAIAIPF